MCEAPSFQAQQVYDMRCFSTVVSLLFRRDGAVVRALASHQFVPSSIPGNGIICHVGLSLLLVLVLAS